MYASLLGVCPESLLMDNDILGACMRMTKGLEVNDETLAFDAVKEVGSNGHFFGIQHTQDRYETAFYNPFLSDWNNYENFEERGSVWTHDRANKMYKQILEEFEAPALNPAIDEELREFVDKRIEEGGAPTDF